MTEPSYRPEDPDATNPIGCVTSWIGSLFRPAAPAYAHAEPKGPVVAHVRGVVVERAPVYQTDGTPCDATGPIVGITLVVDDDQVATTVLEAIADGLPIRVLSGGRG